MNDRNLFSCYLGLLIFLIACSFSLSRHYHIPYPKPPDSQYLFSAEIQRGSINAISEQKPEVVLIGDSALYTGVEDSLLTAALGRRSYSLAVPGSGSAIWYLILKNIVLEAEHHPRYVVISFRDTLLTIPAFRTTGYYSSIVDEYARKNEPLVVKLAYINQMNPLEKFADAYLPPYSARWQLRESLTQQLRYRPGATVWNCPPACVDAAMDAVFGEGNKDNLSFSSLAVYDESILYAPAALNFAESVDASFLPAMIELAQTNGITLIFVRMKNLEYAAPAAEMPALKRYIRALGEYLAHQENIRLLDLAHDAEILPAYFEADGVHFNAEGKSAFSQILARRLNILMKE